MVNVSNYDREDYAGDTQVGSCFACRQGFQFRVGWSEGTEEGYEGTLQGWQVTNRLIRSSTLPIFQRDQLQKYVNGEIELSEMSDPELSTRR